MNSMLHTFRKLVGDERGGEVIEWAMVCGLIIVATIVTIAAFGTKLLARWTSLNASMD
jgi:pilus assembly protein Flp/PilA